MIDEQEFRDLFKEESDEHLLCLDEGLLALEKNPFDQTTLDQVFRAAHSLKGAARMLYLSDVETVAHRCEDVLRLGKNGDSSFSGVVVGHLFPLLSAMHALIDEALGGARADIDVAGVIATLDAALAGHGSDSAPVEAVPVEAAPGTVAEPVVAEQPVAPEAEVAAPDEEEQAQPGQPVNQQYRIETIRVPTKKLDGLLSQMGELIVARGRVSRRMVEIEQLADAWEEWQRSPVAAAFLNQAGQGGGRSRFDQLGSMIQSLYRASAEDMTRLESVADKIAAEVRNIRLLPLSSIFNLFSRLVRDQAAEQGKKVDFRVFGGDTQADKQIVEEMKDPLMHMLRNAVDHGIEMEAERVARGKPATGTLSIRARQTATNIVIEICDDGRGIDPEVIARTALKRKLLSRKELDLMSIEQIQALIFSPGFSTSQFVTDISGRGVGMDVVRNNVERLKGHIEIDSVPGNGCTMRILLPMTLSSTRVLVAEVNHRPYAIPAEAVNTSIHLDRNMIFSIEGRKNITWQGTALHVVALADLLEVDERLLKSRLVEKQAQEAAPAKAENGYLLCVVVEVAGERFGLLVDDLLDEREVVVKPHGSLLRRIRNVSSVTILDSGEVCMILNPQDLARSVHRHVTMDSEEVEATVEQRKQVVLLVEDSMTTRIQEKRILEGGGYEVVTAVDGIDAMNKLVTNRIDAVVSDIVMPNVDGLELTAMIRRESKYNEMPVILVTTLASDQDKKAGLAAGANAYISKPRFDQKILLETLRRLI
ncbi:hybrid sensor histidine kinase/response regulator [Mariprofundus erugo]|uniref:hybrid sensor histidine kinase/response regulator n=1 Tax=Mariprofundus erugo TaxID=2528639 RepID=UPI0010FE013C|nr:hybrid sensor histidine kinase/response regulator [Mariprofundus erugo]TLS76184.1 hybrid sensor histidine kinase/response regulator [Mariprofundus erugo]